MSFYLLWLALSLGVPVGIAYGIWTACGVALVAVIAKFLFKEPLTPVMMLGIALNRVGCVHDRARGRRPHALNRVPTPAFAEHPGQQGGHHPGHRYGQQTGPQSGGIGDEPDQQRRAEEADPHEPRDHGQTGAGSQAGQLIGAVHGGGHQGGHPQSREREPGDRGGDARKASAAPSRRPRPSHPPAPPWPRRTGQPAGRRAAGRRT